MDELVSRLRTIAEAGYGGPNVTPHIAQAADEIVRLRSESSHLRAAAEYGELKMAQVAEEIESLRAVAESLRGMLREKDVVSGDNMRHARARWEESTKQLRSALERVVDAADNGAYGPSSVADGPEAASALFAARAALMRHGDAQW